MDINKARTVARKEIFINADIEKVWEILTRINEWNKWQPDIMEAKIINGELIIGSNFEWISGGVIVRSIRRKSIGKSSIRLNLNEPEKTYSLLILPNEF